MALLHAADAHVIFGDYNKEAGEVLAAKLGSQCIHFVHMGVRNHANNVQLFKTALEKCGRIDHAVAVAGLMEQGN